MVNILDVLISFLFCPDKQRRNLFLFFGGLVRKVNKQPYQKCGNVDF